MTTTMASSSATERTPWPTRRRPLSYLIQGSPKPIVLTGSQKPIHMDITDSKTNLWDSFAVACDGRLPGVTVVFGGRILLGTRARKTYSKSYGAFSSINHPILGVVREGKVTPYLCPQAQALPTFYHALDQKVSPGQAGAGAVPGLPGLCPGGQPRGGGGELRLRRAPRRLRGGFTP